MGNPLSLMVTAAAWSELSKFNVGTFRDAHRAFDRLREGLERIGSTDVAEARVVIDRFAVTYSVDSSARILRIIGVAPT